MLQPPPLPAATLRCGRSRKCFYGVTKLACANPNCQMLYQFDPDAIHCST
ncbi:hypothetical protein A2U01_0015318, partial [Trifolium medium]|nr:hypothetical protein [Trifolium medium]